MKALKSRIAVTDRHGRSRQLVQLVGLKDGGFAVTVPYHSARRGYLFKHAVDYRKRNSYTPLGDLTSYTADDRVKLSLHIDGFVQFSGENPGSIISGRDEMGRPKGLGLMVNPLNRPLSTNGPTFGVTAWGIEEFDEPKASKPALTFRPEDVYYRDTTEQEWNGYLLEGFVRPRSALLSTALHGGVRVLTEYFPNYEEMPRDSGLLLPSRLSGLTQGGAVFNLTVIDVGSPEVIVCLLVSRAKLDMPSASGFGLHSPSDMREALAASYPSPFGEPEGGEGPPSLNYRPSTS